MLIIVRANGSLSSHALMLPNTAAVEGRILAIICVVVGAIGITYVPSTNDHNFFALKISVSLCFQMLNRFRQT